MLSFLSIRDIDGAKMANEQMEHAFSIEMKSKKHVKNISISNETHNRVLFEGTLGKLEELSMIEGAVLEVRGTNGTLRMDLREDELRKIYSRKKKGLE